MKSWKKSAGLVLLATLIGSLAAVAQLPPGGGTNSSPTYSPLNSWSFNDRTNWTSDYGTAPLSFTNLALSILGDSSSLSVNSNVPAWLHFNVRETNGATNLTLEAGTVTFWFASNWSSTNAGGTGPGEIGRLLEVGGYTPDSSYGLWSLYVDEVGENIYFSAQTNDLSSNLTTYVSAPISWTTNYFHFVALTYTATNTALYLDGALVTNGPGMTIYPGPEASTNGFFIGSDGFGENQAHGLFNDLLTYDVPLDADTIAQTFSYELMFYMMYPQNTAMFAISSEASIPSGGLSAYYNIITGLGGLQYVGSVSAITSSNLWITNVTATATSGGMNMTFTIQGGYDGAPYDVFASSILSPPSSEMRWAWKGQGYHGNIYTLTNLPNTTCFLMLGTPLDSDFDGLTDAYEWLVSKTDPNNADSDGDGISDSDELLFGSDPLAANGSWRLDTDSDGLPDAYETFVGWNPISAEVPPLLPAYNAAPIP